MQYDIRSMKKRVDTINLNTKIYKRDLDKNIKVLKEKFGISESQINSKIKELEIKKKDLMEKEQKYLKKASIILKGADDD